MVYFEGQAYYFHSGDSPVYTSGTICLKCSMATNNETSSFEDFPEPETSNDSDGSDWIDLQPGDTVTGRITSFNPNAGRNGVVEIDGRPTYITASIRRQLIAELVEGSQMALRVSEEEESFEDDDGEEVTYNPKEARFRR
mgnify:CR=1 FL=1